MCMMQAGAKGSVYFDKIRLRFSVGLDVELFRKRVYDIGSSIHAVDSSAPWIIHPFVRSYDTARKKSRRNRLRIKERKAYGCRATLQDALDVSAFQLSYIRVFDSSCLIYNPRALHDEGGPRSPWSHLDRWAVSS